MDRFKQWDRVEHAVAVICGEDDDAIERPCNHIAAAEQNTRDSI